MEFRVWGFWLQGSFRVQKHWILNFGMTRLANPVCHAKRTSAGLGLESGLVRALQLILQRPRLSCLKPTSQEEEGKTGAEGFQDHVFRLL